MSPERLKQDPIIQTVEALDRSRRWLTFLAVLLVVMFVCLIVLATALRDLGQYVKDPAGRSNRLDYQCAVERKLGLAEVDCG